MSKRKARLAITVAKAGIADEVIADKLPLTEAAKQVTAQPTQPRKTKPLKQLSLKDRVWRAFSFLMKKFDKEEHTAVRQALHRLVCGVCTATPHGDEPQVKSKLVSSDVIKDTSN